MRYLDSHVHFWQLARGDYRWLKPGNAALYRDYVPDDLFAAASGCDMEGFIAVQAAATTAETAYLLALSDRHERIAGVVGYLNPLADSFAEDYGRLRRHPRFAGIRIDRAIVEPCRQEPAPARLLANLALLERDGLAVDLLIGPADMPVVAGWLARLPRLKAAINHIGSPDVRRGELEPWATRMGELASFPRVYCKWSGLITAAGGADAEALAPYIGRTAELFGPSRILFGSDWPVALTAGTYRDVVRLFERLLPQAWSESERDGARRANARRFYMETGDRSL